MKFKNQFKGSTVQRFKLLGFLIFFVVELLNLLNLKPASAQQTPFYQGKTIRIIVGLTPGGFYDRWARLLARFMPLYIPGNPSFIVQNMPGAGSMIAMNHVFGVAKPDGLTVVMPNYGVYLDQLAGRKKSVSTSPRAITSARRRKAISFSTPAPTPHSNQFRT